MISSRNSFAIVACVSIATPMAWAQTADLEFLSRATIQRDILRLGNVNSSTSFEAHSSYIDGEVVSYPPSKTTHDEMVVSKARTFVKMPVAASWHAFLEGGLQSNIRQTAGEEEPIVTKRSHDLQAFASVLVSYRTPTGLDLYGGGSYVLLPQQQTTTYGPVIDVHNEIAQGSGANYHFGFARRGGTTGGGFFYSTSAPIERQMDRRTEPETETTSTVEQSLLPSTMGMLVETQTNWGVWRGEFASVAAGDGGPTRTDGQPIQDDYLRMVAEWESLSPSVFGKLCASVFYRTLSYSSNRDMDLLLVPITSVHLGFDAQQTASRFKWGFIYAYANQRQSIPEFNADYGLHAFGGFAQLAFAF